MILAASFDQHVVQTFSDHRTHLGRLVARDVATTGTSFRVLALVAVVGLVVVIVTRAWQVGAAVVLAVAGAGLASGVLKALVDRSRPPYDLAMVHATGSSWPSTEAARTAAAATALVLAIRWTDRRVRAAAIAVLAATVGFVGVTMVYVGAHWPSDVLAGWALGLAVGYLAVKAVAWIFRTMYTPAT